MNAEKQRMNSAAAIKRCAQVTSPFEDYEKRTIFDIRDRTVRFVGGKYEVDPKVYHRNMSEAVADVESLLALLDKYLGAK